MEYLRAFHRFFFSRVTEYTLRHCMSRSQKGSASISAFAYVSAQCALYCSHSTLVGVYPVPRGSDRMCVVMHAVDCRSAKALASEVR